ncbi:MAG: DNA topoisomerase 3, partial [Colwellia sp.]|nr:DNA topoisomerase 3 [Colwellia sp.]
EVIDYLNVSKTKKNNIKRLLISDLNLSAVKRSLTSLKPNQDFMPLSISALARSRADWLYGINLTRACTLQGQKQGYNSVLSVGRVQTPVLGLVARREQEIANFTAKPFYQVLAHLSDNQSSLNNGVSFTAKWQPSEACHPYCDEEGRVLVKALAMNVVSRIHGQEAIVKSVNTERKQQSQPLPFNLSSLQITAAKQFSMNAKLVLDVCQALYEKHKLITYPRSDCRHLPKEQFKQAQGIIDNLAVSNLPCCEQAKNAEISIKSKAWNDKKVTAHHAIIPTEKSPKNITLNSFEKNIYLLIVRQYLAQFYPVYQYQHTQLEIIIAGGLFTASEKSPLQQGWKILFPSREKPTAEINSLPSLQEGQVLHCQQGELLEKHTSPPESFTDATLLSAMTGIARFVNDAQIKKVLKETDGLGTDATRAGIIDLLFKRGFLSRQGKKIIATEVGVALIHGLPVQATLPDMTALWESQLKSISNKTVNYQSFILGVEGNLKQFISDVKGTSFTGMPKAPPRKYKKKFVKKRVN